MDKFNGPDYFEIERDRPAATGTASPKSICCQSISREFHCQGVRGYRNG